MTSCQNRHQNQCPILNDQLRYMQRKINAKENELRMEHISLKRMKYNNESSTTKKECTPLEEKASPLHLATFIILRSLKGYKVGDQMRQSDEILCCSKKATAYAMSKLRPNDCVFVMRSDGSFTYALYEGPSDKDPTSMSFQVTERGHFKVVSSEQQFLNRVRVPVLSVPMMEGDVTIESPVTKRSDALDENITSPEWKVSSCDSFASTATPRSVTEAKTKSPIKNRTPSYASSLTSGNDVTNQVQCRTGAEDGQIKTAPTYKAGMDVYYKRQNEKTLSARILKVHLDDLLESYYTIQLEDGREKQTDNDHITLDYVTNQVQCRTGAEDGRIKTVPMYKAGMDVYYKRQNEKALSARILKVHLDDLLEPYYTIQLEDGREKQTDNDHITLDCVTLEP